MLVHRVEGGGERRSMGWNEWAVGLGSVQPLAWSCAGWVAWSRLPEPRFGLALAVGALLAHLGWGLLHLDLLAVAPGALLDLRAGFCVLFVPLGLFAVAPWGAGRAELERFLSAGARALVPGLALARLGCLVAGCCSGIELPAFDPSLLYGRAYGLAYGLLRHPVPAYELFGLGALALWLKRVEPERVAPAFMLGFGALRLALEPLRAVPPLGPPIVDARWLAAGWLVAGALWWLALVRGRMREAVRAR
jgi:hypothetical protein